MGTTLVLAKGIVAPDDPSPRRPLQVALRRGNRTSPAGICLPASLADERSESQAPAPSASNSEQSPGVFSSNDPLRRGCGLKSGWLERIWRGYVPGRSEDISIVPNLPNFRRWFLFRKSLRPFQISPAGALGALRAGADQGVWARTPARHHRGCVSNCGSILERATALARREPSRGSSG